MGFPLCLSLIIEEHHSGFPRGNRIDQLESLFFGNIDRMRNLAQVFISPASGLPPSEENGKASWKGANVSISLLFTCLLDILYCEGKLPE